MNRAVRDRVGQPATAPEFWPARPLPGGPILVSAVLSIHNRASLFRRALDGYMWQTMPPDRWEIVLVDDMSTDDLRQVYAHLIGKINLRHVRMDHTRHRTFMERNPGWGPGAPEDWFHTPALSTNIGVSLARGAVVCLCHPEILHAPDNFARAHDLLAVQGARRYLFGKTWLGTVAANRWLDQNQWAAEGWPAFVSRMENEFGVPAFGPTELYWYTSFLARADAEAVGGVDFAYLGGVGGEDDDFKWRVERAGAAPLRCDDIQGFHQNHSDDKDAWDYKATLEPSRYDMALDRNRRLLYGRRNSGLYPAPANAECDWTAKECIVSVEEHVVAPSPAPPPPPAPRAPLRILCICEGGFTRSVCLAGHLRNRGGVPHHDALAASWRFNSAETLERLCDWAEVVVVMEPYMVEKVPPRHRAKVRVCDVGPDRYGQPLHPELVGAVRAWALAEGLRSD